MAGLRIAAGVELPPDLVTQSIAILARKGAGKTYTGSVIVEEVIKAGLPVVVLDPTGAWWGLRSSADGAKPGLPVVIFGGDHADVPLERTAGKVIADVVLEHPGAYILDLSELPSKAAEQTFAADFLETLYRGKRPDTGPLLLVVDEADVFAPQRPGPEQTRTLGALESIVRRGRIKGLGDMLITQRAAVLNKNVLTQTEVLIVMQTTGPQDRAAIREWIVGNDVEDVATDVVASLAGMDTGQAWVWSPSFLRMLRRVNIRERRTFDSSRTPKAGETVWVPTEFARIDLTALGKRIADTVERAKANDPETLRRRIAELERIAAAPAAAPVVERVEVPAITPEEVEAIAAIGRMAREGFDRFLEGMGKLEHALAIATSTVAPDGRSMQSRPARPVAPPPRAVATPLTVKPASPEPLDTSWKDRGLSGYAKRLIATIARSHPVTLTRASLAVLSKSSPKSSSYDGAIAELRRAGLVEMVGDTYVLTAAGWEQMGGVPPAPQSPEELRAQWRSSLPRAEATLFDVLVAAYPDDIDRATLAERSGYSPTSSSFDGAISTLRRTGLVSGDASGLVASPVLFE